MKPLVSTSVFGLVPLPQLSETHDRNRKPASDVRPDPTLELGPAGYCFPFVEDTLANKELAYSNCNVGRMGFYAQLVAAIWRRLVGTRIVRASGSDALTSARGERDRPLPLPRGSPQRSGGLPLARST